MDHNFDPGVTDEGPARAAPNIWPYPGHGSENPTPRRGGRTFRPMPENFAENAWLPHKELTQRYNAGGDTISRWRKELGGENPRSAIPADFAEQVDRSNLSQLMTHYCVGEQRIKSWAKRAGIQIKMNLNSRRRAMPDDFADMAPTMPKNGLMKHYRADITTIRRWIEESGVDAMVYTPPPPPPRQARGFVFGGHARNQITRDLRQVTMYDEAADVLRHHFVVFRCDERGRADQKGEHWRLGNTLLTPDDLLQRADRYRRRAA